MIGYLTKMRFSRIRVRVNEPDYTDLPTEEYDWMRSIYGNIQEVVPEDAPRPLGSYVTTMSFVDANLMHDIMTG